MDGQQQKHPPGRSKFDVIQLIEDSPAYPEEFHQKRRKLELLVCHVTVQEEGLGE